MTTHPLSLTFKAYCKMTEEWFEYEIPLEDFDDIEGEVNDFLEAEGWQEGCSPRTYVEPQLVDY